MMELIHSETPCVPGEVARWHAEHGYLWNVQVNGNVIGCFYIAYAGVACFLHAEVAPGKKPHPNVCMHALREVMKRLKNYAAVYATVPVRKHHLIRFLIRFGFVETDAGYDDEGEMICVLIYRNESCILS